MKIYLSIDDQKQGPFTLFQVEEKLRADEIFESTLGWYDGLEKWQPLRELAPFESLFRLRDAAEEDERKRQYAERLATQDVSSEPDRDAASAIRCIARMAARGIDVMLFSYLAIGVMYLLRSAGLLQASYLDLFSRYSLSLLPFWHLLEVYMTSRWGMTPGKALLGIRVTTSEGGYPDFSNSLRRMLAVFVVGLGCWYFALIAIPLAIYNMWWNGRTFWDTTAKTKVSHQPFHLRQILLPLTLWFTINIILFRPITDINKEVETWKTQNLGQQAREANGN
jgi:uncharacterized RDD family membrane protein YckC